MNKKLKFQNNKGIAPLIIILLLLVLGAVWVGSTKLNINQYFSPKEPIKIGAVLPLTGSATYMGTTVKEGLELGIEEVNSKGGINGRLLELIIEDSKTDPVEAEKVFNKMNDEKRPDVVVSALSSVITKLAPIAEEKEVPFIGIVTVASRSLTENKEWVFRTFWTPDIEVPPILGNLEKQGVKTLGILAINDPYGKDVGDYLSEQFTKKGGEVKVVRFETKENTPDTLTPHLRGLTQMDAVYLIGFDSHVISSLKAVRSLNYKGKVFAPATATLPTVRELKESNGVYVAAPSIYNKDFIFGRELKEKYEKKYAKPLGHYAGKAHDFILMMDGLMEGKSVDRNSIRKTLDGGFVYSGSFGTTNTQKGDHDLVNELYPAQIVDGEVNY